MKQYTFEELLKIDIKALTVDEIKNIDWFPLFEGIAQASKLNEDLNNEEDLWEGEI